MFPCPHPSREQVPVPWDVRPQHLRSPSPWPSGTEGPVRRALRGSWLPVRARDAGSAVGSTPLWPARAHFLRRRRSRRGGIPYPPPRRPLPHSSGPEPPAVLAGGTGQARLGCSRGGTLHPPESRASPQPPRDTPRLPREVGDRLAPGPGKVSVFRLPELRALGPPLRFLGVRFSGTG